MDERLTTVETVVTALHDVLSGQTVLDPTVVDALIRRDAVSVNRLTTREIDVLEQIAQCRSNKAVAAELGITIKAVENHVTAIFRKLGLTDAPDIHPRVKAAWMFLDGIHPTSRAEHPIGASRAD